MTLSEVLQLMSLAAIAGMGVVLLYTARHPIYWARSGRAVTAVAALFLVLAPGVRLIAQVRLLSQADALMANGLMAGLFLAALFYLLLTDGTETP